MPDQRLRQHACLGIEASGTLVAFSAFEAGLRPHTYHVRDEIVGDRISMSIDGQQLCSWRSQFPSTAGYVELFATYAHHSFSHVRVFSQGIAQKVAATAIGDSLVELRRYDDAAQAYARVAVIRGHRAWTRGALPRGRLPLATVTNGEEAFAAWASLKDTPQEGFVKLYAIKRDFASKRYDDVVAGLERLGQAASPELLHEIALAWGEKQARYAKQECRLHQAVPRYARPLLRGPYRGRRTMRGLPVESRSE